MLTKKMLQFTENGKTRWAPTPSGFLHMGNVASMLLTYVLAQRFGWKILLRIDDLDRERIEDSYIGFIFRVIDFLKLDYDEGPSGVEDFQKNWSQHVRLPLYRHKIALLKERDMLYASYVSRKELSTSPLAFLEERNNKDFNLSAAIRVEIPHDIEESWQDFNGQNYLTPIFEHTPDIIIQRKDAYPAYQIATLADDQFFGVNVIIRGEDLVHSTALQRWLSRFCDYPEFCNTNFLHHPLLKDTEGIKFSKTQKSTALELKNRPETLLQLSQIVFQWLNIEEKASGDMSEIQSIVHSSEIF